MEIKETLLAGMKDWLSQLRDEEDPVRREVYSAWKTWFDELDIKNVGVESLSELWKMGPELDGVSAWFKDKSGLTGAAELKEIKARLDALEALVKSRMDDENSSSPESPSQDDIAT